MKTCTQCQTSFEVTEQERSHYAKMAVPEPKLCPDCRVQRRLAWRNERYLYKRNCDLTGKSFISLYAPDAPYTVYAQDVWWSDDWEGKTYGREFDFNRPFFEQFSQLLKVVPQMGMFISHGENSDYCPYSTNYKDSYMCVSGRKGENNYYSFMLNDSRDCMDCYACPKSEQCYECINGVNLYNSIFCRDCKTSNDLAFCLNCEACHNCIGCYGLRHKEYQVFNKPVSKGEFERINQELRSSPKALQIMREKSQQFFLKFPQKALQLINTEHSSGDYLLNCRNAHQCYFSEDLQDCAYVWNTPKSKDCVDMNYSSNTELIYNAMSNVNSYHCIGNVASWDVKNTDYCYQSFYSNDLFGCIGLKHQKYCIFNKQYTQGEYQSLRQRIVDHMKQTGEWGQFFPIEISPFAYNETIAQEFFPLEKEEIEKRGWHFRPATEKISDVKKVIPAARLPDAIHDIPDDILNWAIQSEQSGRSFRIIAQELDFYRKMNLPVPHLHPDERHQRRLALLNPRQLYLRTCTKCQAPIQTTYSPDRPEIVYCEHCYLKNIY